MLAMCLSCNEKSIPRLYLVMAASALGAASALVSAAGAKSIGSLDGQMGRAGGGWGGGKADSQGTSYSKQAERPQLRKQPPKGTD